MTRWLVTGAAGMLGRDLCAALGTAATGLARADLDITDGPAVDAAVAGHDIVVNAAGWTDVDGAEGDETAATGVNGDGVRRLAEACARHRVPLLQVSTDYVFAGDADRPYAEDSPTGPIGAYGRGKLAGELAVRELLPEHGFVVRTAWLYGEHGRNFVSTMLDLAARRDTLDVVNDQLGQPTWSRSLAVRLVALGDAALAGRAPGGIYHGTASGAVTWFGLARAVFELSGLDPERVRPATSDRFPRPARRPAYSVLGHDRWAKAGLVPLPDWHADLTVALPLLRAARVS